MYARATTTISIIRGEDTDEWGDPIDSDTVVVSGVIASLIEYKVYQKGEVTANPKNIRYARLRLTYRTDLLGQDRILDERSGLVWTIQNASSLQSPAIGQDWRIDLMHVA